MRAMAACILFAINNGAFGAYFTQSTVWGNSTSPIPGNTYSYNSSWHNGPTTSQAEIQLPRTGAAASTELHGSDTGLHLYARSSSNMAFGNFEINSSRANAVAVWGDTVRLANGISPASIRIHLEVTGSYDYFTEGNKFGDSRNQGSFGMTLLNNSFLTSPGYSSESYLTNFSYFSGGSEQSSVGMGFSTHPDPSFNTTNSFNVTNLHIDTFMKTISWEVDFTLKRNVLGDGYNLGIVAIASSNSANGARSIIDFGNTVKLTGISTVDGTSLNEFTRFDSGYTIPTANAVPGPGGAILLAIGGLISPLVFRNRRRRDRAAA